jgi:hypothetical protein
MNKTLKFYPELVPLILSGEKVVTWRLFDDKNLQTGDVVDLVDRSSMNRFAIAKLTKVVEKKMGKLEDEDWDGHEKFSSEKEMYTTYAKYYNQRITKNTPLKIIHFEISTE